MTLALSILRFDPQASAAILILVIINNVKNGLSQRGRARDLTRVTYYFVEYRWKVGGVGYAGSHLYVVEFYKFINIKNCYKYFVFEIGYNPTYRYNPTYPTYYTFYST